MALLVANCTACGICAPLCPNGAIAVGETYRIRAEKCTECYGFHPLARCALACPLGGIIKDPDRPEGTEELLAKHRRWRPAGVLQATQEWQPWED